MKHIKLFENFNQDEMVPVDKAKKAAADLGLVEGEFNAQLAGEVFNDICDDVNAVEYCLKQGLDPNFGEGLPLRRCARGSWKSPSDIGEGYLDVFKLLIEYGANYDIDSQNNQPMRWAADYGRLDFIDYLVNELGVKKGFKSTIDWVGHNKHLNEEKKQEVINYLQQLADKYER